MTTTNLGRFKTGEKPAPLEVDMNAGNLTGFTAAANVKPRGGTAAARTATVSDPTNSKVTYTWQAADFTEPGVHFLEVWAGNGTNRYASVTFTYVVEPPVGTAPSI